MRGESPEFKRCCFCLPLRRGLLAWGYTKLALNLLAIAYMVAIVLWILLRRDRSGDAVLSITIYTVITACLLVDLCFDIIFIVASHKKSVKLLNVSYIYNMVWLGFVLLGSCFQMYMNLYFLQRTWELVEYRMNMLMEFLLSAGLAFSIIFVQIYLILLIRSEMAKLRKQSLEMQFTNHLVSGEPQCTLHNASLADQCVGEEQFVQDCTGKKQVIQNCTGEKQAAQDCCTDEKQICCTNENSPI